MKVCFIGLGSIAKRHIGNLRDLLGDSVEIDVLRSGNGHEINQDIKALINNVYYTKEDIDISYDAIFITNPTSMHYETLVELNRHSDYFFIEKPAFENENEDISCLDKEKVYYTACPLRYTNVIQYLKNNIDFSSVYSMRCISSSYLPDWRPGIDYRKTYSAHKELGGGVSIDLIHEWDYIHYLVGSPNSVKNIIGKKSDLEIDSDDIAIYIAEYDDKVVEMHLDYFGRKTIRKVELFSRTETVEADLVEQKVTYLSTGEVIDLSQGRNEYQKRELTHFINIIKGKIKSDNDLEDACTILKIAKGH